MPDTSKLEKLNRELEKSEKKLRKAINDEKVLQHQLRHFHAKKTGIFSVEHHSGSPLFRFHIFLRHL